MLKNKEIKCFFRRGLFILIFTLLIGISFPLWISKQYQQELMKSNGYLLSAVIKEYPELEEEMVDAILSGKGNTKEGAKILEQYGLENSSALRYLENLEYLKHKSIFLSIFFIGVIFFFCFISYLLLLRKQYQHIRSLGNYVDQVLNEKENLEVWNYDEGDFSTLKNDIYKLMVKLKEGRDQSLQDKKELEQILSDISHQIRTPLTSMYVINDLLKKEDIDSITKQQFLEKNRLQLERMEWLVTSLLKMSRLDSGSVHLKLEKTDVKEIVEKAIEPIQIPIELKNIELVVEEIESCEVELDPEWTVEVFVNILKNAYEHTEEGGKITISISKNPIYTEVSIQDNGCGIKKEELSHIFERFYTGSGNKESIGIGLNMAKKIMEKQFGEIEVTSKVGEGTTFFLKFYKK